MTKCWTFPSVRLNVTTLPGFVRTFNFQALMKKICLTFALISLPAFFAVSAGPAPSTTDNLPQGTTNLYSTLHSVSNLLAAGNSITITSSNGKLFVAYTGGGGGVASTDFVPQGATNLYSTLNSISNLLSAGNNIKITSSGGRLQIINSITSADLVPPGATNVYTTLN